MNYDYNEWSERHKDTIALCVGGAYTVALIIFAILTYIYIK